MLTFSVCLGACVHFYYTFDHYSLCSRLHLAPDFYIICSDLTWFITIETNASLLSFISIFYSFCVFFLSARHQCCTISHKTPIYLFISGCVCRTRTETIELFERNRKEEERTNAQTKQNKFYAMKMKNYAAVKQSNSISLDNKLWEMRLMCCNRGDFISHELHTRYKSPSDSSLKKLFEKNYTGKETNGKKRKEKNKKTTNNNSSSSSGAKKGKWKEPRVEDS